MTEEIKNCLDVLQNGGIILYPTDTVWGIGCDATNAGAVAKIHEIKRNLPNQPYILLVSSIEMLKEYVEYIHPRIETLLLFHERPLTIIYEKAKNLPSLSTGTDGSVAIRITQDPFNKALIEAFGKPLVATSAHIVGDPSPNHFGEISSAVIVGVDFVVKYRTMDKDMNQPSVIAKLDENEELLFLRE